MPKPTFFLSLLMLFFFGACTSTDDPVLPEGESKTRKDRFTYPLQFFYEDVEINSSIFYVRTATGFEELTTPNPTLVNRNDQILNELKLSMRSLFPFNRIGLLSDTTFEFQQPEILDLDPVLLYRLIGSKRLRLCYRDLEGDFKDLDYIRGNQKMTHRMVGTITSLESNATDDYSSFLVRHCNKDHCELDNLLDKTSYALGDTLVLNYASVVFVLE